MIAHDYLILITFSWLKALPVKDGEVSVPIWVKYFNSMKTLELPFEELLPILPCAPTWSRAAK